MKHFVIIGIAFIVAVVLGTTLLNRISNNIEGTIEEAKKEFTERLGDTCIIKEDTLIIMDYSIIRNSFILSNGTEVSTDFIKE